MTALTVPSPSARSRRLQAGPGLWGPRLALGAKFVSLVYLFVAAFLLLAVLVTLLVAGWKPLAVVSGSMEPALRGGAMVMVEPVEADVYYATPSIVAFHDSSRPGSLITHRVVSTDSDETGAVAYTTKGDANRVADSSPIAHDAVVGAVRMVIPFLGLPAMWLAGGQLAVLATFVALTLLALAGLTVRLQP